MRNITRSAKLSIAVFIGITVMLLAMTLTIDSIAVANDLVTMPESNTTTPSKAKTLDEAAEGTPIELLEPTAKVEPDTATISFAGDCCISTYKGSFKSGSLNAYTKSKTPDYFLSKVADIFKADDLTVVNCETVLTDKALKEANKGSGTAYWFRGPTSNAKIFSTSGVDVASTANNHTKDYGKNGVEDTIRALEVEKIAVAKPNVPVYKVVNNITVGILGCGIWSAGNVDSLLPILAEMTKKSDIQVIYPHGGKEGVRVPEKWRTTAFHKLIDNGADLVIAGHAHVLQPLEVYKGKTIVYGLGNFCFGGNTKPENRTIIYQCTLTRNEDNTIKIENKIIPCYVFTGSVNNWQPCPMAKDDVNYSKIIDFMSWNRKSPV